MSSDTNFDHELRQIKSFFSPEVYQMFQDSGAILAGGAILSLMTRQEINDFDIYIPSEEALVNCLANIYDVDDYKCLGDAELGSYELLVHCVTDKSLSLTIDGTPVQLISFDYPSTPEEVFSTFDFTVCMGAFCFQSEQWVFHKDFWKHVSQKILKFSPSTSFPLISALRAGKYKDRGYDISKPEMLRILASCMQLNLEGWDDAKYHVGSMYGRLRDELFDEDVEFSLEELSKQLSLLHSEDLQGHHRPQDDITFPGVIEFLIPPTADPDSKIEEGCHYKWVNSKLMSPVRCGVEKIHYEVGSVVCGGEKGIYCLPPEYLRQRSHIVELTPCGSGPHFVSQGMLTLPWHNEYTIKGVYRVTAVLSGADMPGGLQQISKYFVE